MFSRVIHNDCIAYYTPKYSSIDPMRTIGPAKIYFDGTIVWSDFRSKRYRANDGFIRNDGFMNWITRDNKMVWIGMNGKGGTL